MSVSHWPETEDTGDEFVARRAACAKHERSLGAEEPTKCPSTLESATPKGLRARAEIMREKSDESCARHLEMAADEIERLKAAGTSLIAAMDDMHARGETFTARVSVASAALRAALDPKP